MIRLFVASLAVGALVLTGCGNSPGPVETSNDQPPGGAMGMCAPDVPDCVDMIVNPDSEFDLDDARSNAQALLGVAENELDDTVRIGRRGDEQMMLTMDYVVGRRTVELDSDAEGVFRVVSVTVELPEGPETFTQ